MSGSNETIDDRSPTEASLAHDVPGLIVVYANDSPTLRVLSATSEPLVLGRSHPLFEADDRLSRRHASVAFERGAWQIDDLESRNGTFVNGLAITGGVRQTAPRVLRIGRTLCLPVPDVAPYIRLEQTGMVRPDGFVAGALTSDAYARISQSAAGSDTLLVRGETGAGKEHAANVFHASGRFASGPFVPVNCAAIPEGVAERLLFGAVKGAYSGANADSNGYVQAAEGGVLLLDEIGEINLDVQAKLLRLLESREVLAVGSAKPRRVRLGICLATHRDLRQDVARGRFRADLLYRIAETEVVIPALRDRPEDLPWLIARELRRIDTRLVADARLVEATMLRPWPGNVRELLGAIRRAARAVLGRDETVVALADLDPSAGTELIASTDRPSDAPAEPPPAREAIEAALKAHDGNVSAAARSLGLHRTQLYRQMKRLGIE